MRRGVAVPLLAALALLCAGCATLPLACPAGEQKIVAELVFGRNIGARLGVGEAAFRRFVDREVTPRFPDGFTLLDGRGQYRGQDRGDGATHIVREPSKVLVIALSDEASGRAKLAAIAEAYKQLFAQQSVLTILRPACVSF